MDIKLLDGSTREFHREDTPEKNMKKIKDMGLHQFAIDFFSERSFVNDQLVGDYASKFDVYSKNTENTSNVLNKLEPAEGSINWGGNDPSVLEQKEQLLDLVNRIAPDYKINVPQHLQDQLKDATTTSDTFELDLESLQQAKDLCQKVIDMSSRSEEQDRLELNEKHNQINSLMKLIMSLISAINDAIRKIIQNSQK